MKHLIAIVAALVLAIPSHAQDSEDAMTPERLFDILVALDPDARQTGGGMLLTIEDVPVFVIMDPIADRMRAMVSIRCLEGLDGDDLYRVLQANFDTALDARYAVAQGRLWGIYIHPLSRLSRDQLISGLGQTVNLALTYGGLYTGGAMTFGGGDSAPLQRQLIDRLLEKGQDI